MKMNNTHMKIALGLVLMTGFAQAQTWVGGTGNWTDDNWGLAGGYPGDTANGSAVAIGSGVVTLNTNLPNSLGGGGFTNPFTIGATTLNIGGNITSTAYTTVGAFSNTTVNHSAGTFALGSRFDLGLSGNGYNSVYNLSGGTLDMNNSDFRFGYSATSGGSMSMNVSGTGSFEFGNMNMGMGVIDISGGSVSSTGTLNMDATAGAASTIAIDGSTPTSVSFTTLDAFNTGGSATLQYVLDASGVKAIEVTTLNLNSASNTSILDLDLTNWDGTSGLVGGTHLILADYGSLSGAFSAVNVTGGSGSVVYDYDMGGGDLALAYVIPEPSTLALFGIAGLSLFVGLRRRSNSGR